MARKVTVTLSDDTDDTLSADETVRFALDGVEYEIDLANKNANKLRTALAPYTENARRVGGRLKRRLPTTEDTPKVDPDAVRVWARENGHTIGDRGRIAREIIVAYQAR